MDEVAGQMSIPLDSDGFRRMECPTCEREFKIFVPPEEDDEVGPDEDDAQYSCPYCVVEAPSGGWFTQAQLDLAESILAEQIMGPSAKGLADQVGQISRRSGGLVQARVEFDEPGDLDPLTEADDMKRVDFECHPSNPIKVLDDWDKAVHCFICGSVAA